MKKQHYSLLVLLLLALQVSSQVSEAWTATASSRVNWQRVTPMGDFIVASSSSLASFNADDGQALWSLEKFGGLSEGDVTQVGDSPFLSITKNDIIYLLDPFSGEEKFNSKEAGFDEIKSNDILYQNNGILIFGKSGDKEKLSMVDMGSGKIKWTIEEDFGKIITAAELSDKEILIVTIFNNYRINSQSGDVLWKTANSDAEAQLSKMGAFGSLMKEAVESKTEDMDIDLRFWRHPTKDIFIIGSEQEGQSAMSTSSATSGPSFENVYVAYSMKDGSRLWKDALETKGKIGELVLEENTITVLPDNSNATKINRFDLTTKAGKWGKKGKGVKVKGSIYDYVATSKGYLLVSQNAGKNYLSYLDTNSGTLTFEKPVKIAGEVVNTASIDKGILFITTQEINILDVSSGSLVFSKGISTTPNLVTEKDGKLYAFDRSEGKVKTIDMNTGEVNTLSSASVSFEGKESPSAIEVRDTGVLLTSSQNLALVGHDGSLIAQKYFKAPQEKGLLRALRYAQAVRASYIGAVSYAASAQFQAATPKVTQEDAVAGAMVGGIGEAYGQLGDQATDFARESFKRANARFKATSNGRDFIIVLAEVEKGNALLKVSKETGEIMGEISLGKERNPIYAVDDVTSQVYLNTDPYVVTSFKFQ